MDDSDSISEAPRNSVSPTPPQPPVVFITVTTTVEHNSPSSLPTSPVDHGSRLAPIEYLKPKTMNFPPRICVVVREVTDTSVEIASTSAGAWAVVCKLTRRITVGSWVDITERPNGEHRREERDEKNPFLGFRGPVEKAVGVFNGYFLFLIVSDGITLNRPSLNLFVPTKYASVPLA